LRATSFASSFAKCEAIPALADERSGAHLREMQMGRDAAVLYADL
jgi:hypothetical protein